MYSKQERIRKELTDFYNKKVILYRQTNNNYEADRLASVDIFTKLKDEKESK